MEMQRPDNLVPTISRVIGERIFELVYDPADRKTALVASSGEEWTIGTSFNVESGETLVPYTATNNLIRHECVLFPSHPAPSGGKTQLLRDVEAYLHRYVDLSQTFERIAAHYILLTWVFDAFAELPYLRFKGDFGSGKTRALIALGSIAYKGFFASGASTVSPIFHTLDSFGGTLILDEADLRFSDKTSEIVKILNQGSVRGLPVLRSVQGRLKEFNPAAFNVFGPKIIAMRGSFRDAALESRFLTESMVNKPLRSDVPIQLPRMLSAEALSLRNRLLHFRLSNLFSIRSNPARIVPGIDPRLNQTALSLTSLIDEPDLLAELSRLLRDRHAEIATIRNRSAVSRTMAALTQAFNDSKGPFVALGEIAQRANASSGPLDEAVTPRQAGQILREHFIPMRKSHGVIVALRRTAIPQKVDIATQREA